MSVRPNFHADTDYTNLVETCLLARRKRSIARERTERYPWYQGYLKGGRLRNKKSLVEVSKSDVEDDLSDDEDAMASEGASDEWDSNANRGSDGRDVSGNDSGEQSADSDAPDPMLNEVSDSESGLKAIKQEAMSSYTMAGDGKVSEEASPYEIVKREAFGEERGSSQEGQSDVDEVGDAPLSAFTPNDVVLVGDDALDSDSD